MRNHGADVSTRTLRKRRAVPATGAAVKSDDLLFMSGGGILAHPGGPAAGVASIHQAWAAARAGIPLAEQAWLAPELAAAIAFFGK